MAPSTTLSNSSVTRALTIGAAATVSAALPPPLSGGSVTSTLGSLAGAALGLNASGPGNASFGLGVVQGATGLSTISNLVLPNGKLSKEQLAGQAIGKLLADGAKNIAHEAEVAHQKRLKEDEHKKAEDEKVAKQREEDLKKAAKLREEAAQRENDQLRAANDSLKKASRERHVTTDRYPADQRAAQDTESKR